MGAVASRGKRADTAPNNRGGRQAWTFSSSGWLFVYFFGVIKCLKDFGQHRCVTRNPSDIVLAAKPNFD